MHLCFDAASAVIAAPSSPDRPTEAFRCAEGLVTRDGTGTVGLPRPSVLAGRCDRGCTSGGDGIVPLAGVERAVGSDAADLLIWWDLVQKLGQHGRVTNMLVVNSVARISSVVSSFPMWILRQTLRFVPPCLRAFHSPSPSTLMPVLSINRCNGPPDPQ